jgi:hypothetical protein
MYVPAEQFAHTLHNFSFAMTENFPEPQSAHTRSVSLVPSVATNCPPKQLLHAVHAEVDEANVAFLQIGIFVGKTGAAVLVDALMVDTKFVVLTTTEPLVVVGVAGATSQTVSEAALPLTKMPLPHSVQFKQCFWFETFANVPGSHTKHDLSVVGVPLVATKLPAVQFTHFVQVGWLDPVEKAFGPHREHVRSELGDPTALT